MEKWIEKNMWYICALLLLAIFCEFGIMLKTGGSLNLKIDAVSEDVRMLKEHTHRYYDGKIR